jgi:hypothetical protein
MFPIVVSRHLNVGIILFEKMADQVPFALSRFIHNMEYLRTFDPDAHLHGLQSTFRELKRHLEDPQERPATLKLLLDSFSNVLQAEGPNQVMISGDPIAELDRLCSILLSIQTRPND